MKMNEETYRIRRHMKIKLIVEHEKSIAWHEKEIRKIKKQMNILGDNFVHSS